MCNTTRLLLAGLFAVTVLLTPQLSSGRTSSGKLGLLWRPASTHPVIQLHGKSFSIEAVAPSSAKGWEASLVPPHSSWKLIKLTLSGAAYDSKSKRWKITATIPATTPEELYGLQLSHFGASDTNKIAVKVLKAFPQAYYVAHYTDTQNTAVLAGHTSKMKSIVSELNLLQPEFAINTGDLVTYGNSWPQGANEYKNFIAELEKSRVATFNIPGNHDIYHMRCWERTKYQAQYEEFIGERAYSFDFGKQRYTGFELSGYTWMCPHTNLTTAQQVWLKADFTAAASAGTKPLVLFAHQLEYNVKLASSNLHKICDSHKLPLYLYGHIHSDKVNTAGKAPTHYVATVNAGASRYRLIDVANGKVVTYGYAGVAKNSIPTGKVSAGFSPASNGKSKDVTATVKSGLNQALKYLKLTFVMAAPTSGKSYQVSGGTLYQVVHTAKGPTYVYVRGITVKAKAQAKVRVWLAATPDAGPDTGTPDAGLSDAKAPDAVVGDGGGPDVPPWDLGPDTSGDLSTADLGPDSGGKDSNGYHDSTTPDRGHDTGVAPDAGPAADSSQEPVTAEGCNCDLSGDLPSAGMTPLLLVLWWVTRRRRRR